MESTKEKKKTVKENNFLMFDCIIKNSKENQIQLKLYKNLCIFKLFNFIWNSFFFFFFFFLITVDVRASLRAPRLIPRGPEVNDRVNLQWPWGDSNWWPLGSKPKAWPTEGSFYWRIRKKKRVGIFYENNLKDPKQKIMAFTSNNTMEAINQYIMIRSLIKSNI